jgi:hypothetical protein
MPQALQGFNPVKSAARLRRPVRTAARRGLLSLGRRLPAQAVCDLRFALGYLELGGWLAGQPGAPRPPAFADRRHLFAQALAYMRGSRPLYLEFGVWKGDSLRWWAEHLTDPAARLVGFDSFEGLPEDWQPEFGEGCFRTAGPPHIPDSRVSFVVGWFGDTLSTYEMPGHDQLVINIDCDLYSSTRQVLRWLEPYLRPGTLVYFDELADRDHEMRAFLESLADGGRSVTPLGLANGGVSWLFRYE